MAASQTPMPVFNPESAREAYDAMATKEGRKEMLRNHLLEFIVPHASHALAMGVNAMYAGNRAKTAAQGGASAAVRGAAGAATAGPAQALRGAAGAATAQAASAGDAAKLALTSAAGMAAAQAAGVAATTTRDRAAAVLNAGNVSRGQQFLPGRAAQSALPGGPATPENPSVTADAAAASAAAARRVASASLTPPIQRMSVQAPEEGEEA